MQMNRRVVVTGMGVISPVGNDVDTFWRNLTDGVCGIDYIKSIPTDDLPSKIAGEVKDFDPAAYEIEPPFVRKQDRFTVFAVAAALPASAAYSEATVTAEALYSSPSYTVAQPRANPNSGTYTENLYVKLTCITSGARIFYTTDGTTPTVYSDEYITPIRIKGKKGESVTTVIRAIAVNTGYKTSDVSEYVYNIQIPIEPDVKYMEIKNKPNKTKYKKGDDLNLTGGKITCNSHSQRS